MSVEKLIQKFDQIRTSFLRDQKEKFLTFLKLTLEKNSYLVEWNYYVYNDVGNFDMYRPHITIKIMQENRYGEGYNEHMTIECYNQETIIETRKKIGFKKLDFSILDDEELLDIITKGQKSQLNPDAYQEDDKDLTDIINASVKDLGIERQWKINNFLSEENDEV